MIRFRNAYLLSWLQSEWFCFNIRHLSSPRVHQRSIRSCKSKERQYNGQRKRTKEETTIYKNTTHNTKDRETRTPLKTGGELQELRMGKKFLLHQWHLTCNPFFLVDHCQRTLIQIQINSTRTSYPDSEPISVNLLLLLNSLDKSVKRV